MSRKKGVIDFNDEDLSVDEVGSAGEIVSFPPVKSDLRPIVENYGNDSRADVLNQGFRDGSRLKEMIDAHLGEEMDEDERQVVREALVKVHGEMDNIRSSSISIGYALLEAKKRLGTDTGGNFRYLRVFDFNDLVQLDRSTAIKLVKVAETEIEKRILRDDMPRSFSVAYELCTLKDTDLKLARERGLVRQDVRRQAIIDFKRELRIERSKPTEKRERLRVEREALFTRQQALYAELDKVNSRLTDIDEELNDLNERTRHKAQEWSASSRVIEN